MRIYKKKPKTKNQKTCFKMIDACLCMVENEGKHLGRAREQNKCDNI